MYDGEFGKCEYDTRMFEVRFRIVSLFVYMPQKCVRYGTDASYINNKI